LSVIRYPLSVRNRHKINWTFIVQNFQKGEPACSPSPFIRYNQFLLETHSETHSMRLYIYC
ncbi:MAG: hypothetical protein VSS75_033805, partial [Candidatus Parabeggiatoa sp.]|nr:hypothetical protein [Candidatus Parabeggiatoa sp.]